MDQVRVVAEAPPAEFVETRRLEEAAGGAVGCTWRNILAGYYRSLYPPTRLRLARPSSRWHSALPGGSGIQPISHCPEPKRGIDGHGARGDIRVIGVSRASWRDRPG